MDLNNLYKELDLSLIIEKALDYYDNKNIEYSKYINTDEIKINRDSNTININNKNFKYEILGLFDNTSHVWMWAWMIPEFMYNETNIVRELLNYGLKISPTSNTRIPNDRLYLKTQMVNSRFLLEDEFQLELHLAIASYLAKDKFNFIYSKRKYLNKEKTKYIIVYYLII
jgi:hypothetical protein